LRELNLFLDFLNRHQNESLVLATILETKGSSYRKAGAQKIIAPCGEAAGLISGGCLEAEIIQKALKLKDNKQTHVFDTTSKEDRLFGYSTGCQGILTLGFEKFNPGYLTKADLFEERATGLLSVHIIGAGADLDPLEDLLKCMGWEHSFYSTQFDLVKERQSTGWAIQHIKSTDFDFEFKNPERTAVLLMSHNYPTDLEILSQLALESLAYVGILGPSERRHLMLTDLEKIYQITWPQNQLDRIHGPMGLPGMGRGEAAIALSIISHLQQIFYSEQH
jgi:xanthine dehydrogenase accessory factor